MTNSDLTAKVRDAIQGILDNAGDGYSVSQFVVCMGLERIVNGELETAPWLWAPDGQPEWMTDGLLDSARELRNDISDY